MNHKMIARKRLDLPSGKLTWLAGKFPCSIESTSSEGPFSIAMLVYQTLFSVLLRVVSGFLLRVASQIFMTAIVVDHHHIMTKARPPMR